MTKHTLGPWVARGEQILAKVDNAFIARANSANFGLEQRLANARLIAAAPELLDAAEDVETAIHGLQLDPGLKEATDYLYAIICKARGHA